MNVTVPAQRPPGYGLADGVHHGPVNALASITEPADHYTIVGAGKTGADACLFLLRNGVDPDDISWITPRDSWFLDRALIQPGQFFETTATAFIDQFRCVAESTSIPDLFHRLERAGLLLRLDDDIEPTMYRCSTITTAERDQLQTHRRHRPVRPGAQHRHRRDRPGCGHDPHHTRHVPRRLHRRRARAAAGRSRVRRRPVDAADRPPLPAGVQRRLHRPRRSRVRRRRPSEHLVWRGPPPRRRDRLDPHLVRQFPELGELERRPRTHGLARSRPPRRVQHRRAAQRRRWSR